MRYHADDEVDEAQWVTREIAKLHDGGDLRWADIAVFYRTNAQSRVVEEHLTRMGVPYKVIGGTRFYDRREVKDALAYLKAVINPHRRGVGEADPQHAQAGHRRLAASASSTPTRPATASASSTRSAAPTTPASAARR